MRYLLTVWVGLLSGMAVANEPPSVPEGGLTHVFTSPCQDPETGQKGTCYIMQDVEGTLYTTFWQYDMLMFIRKDVPGGYETIWVNDQYNSI